VLKDHLVKGYTINEKRLKEQTDQLEQLKHTVKLLGNVLETQPLNSDEATGPVTCFLPPLGTIFILNYINSYHEKQHNRRSFSQY
jgi:hypothetical protein